MDFCSGPFFEEERMAETLKEQCPWICPDKSGLKRCADRRALVCLALREAKDRRGEIFGSRRLLFDGFAGRHDDLLRPSGLFRELSTRLVDFDESSQEIHLLWKLVDQNGLYPVY